MNTRARLKARTNPPIIEYYEDVDDVDSGEPDLLLTRVWMGIVPPDEEPGYVSVVGEVYDGSMEQKARPKIVLDEGIALDPEDFDEEGREQWADLLYLPNGTPRVERPSLDDLRHAAVALKDIYSYSGREPILAFCPPGHDHFHNFMLTTYGFTYPGKYDDLQWREWYPFFRNQLYRLSLSAEPPLGDNPDYAHELVNSLIAGKAIQFDEELQYFRQPELQNPRLCVGMVLAAMQMIDWSWKLVEYRELDGFGDWREEDEEEVAERDLANDISSRLWMAGYARNSRPFMRKEEANPYLDEDK